MLPPDIQFGSVPVHPLLTHVQAALLVAALVCLEAAITITCIRALRPKGQSR